MSISIHASLLTWHLMTHAVFGFVVSLLEGLPIIGLVSTVSNCIGAAMWAHGKLIMYSFHASAHVYVDHEKKQHFNRR